MSLGGRQLLVEFELPGEDGEKPFWPLHLSVREDVENVEQVPKKELVALTRSGAEQLRRALEYALKTLAEG